MRSPGRSAPSRKKTAGPRTLSTWPSMTDVPVWPGVTEYLYQAAALGLRRSGGTCMAPSGLTPRRRSADRTPMAGMSTERGIERRSDSHHALPADGPVVPAAVAEGCGACCWAATAAPTAAAPPTMRTAPAAPATRARRPPGLGDLTDGGANLPSGQDMTTRNPAMRRRCAFLNAVPFAFLSVFYPRSLISQ